MGFYLKFIYFNLLNPFLHACIKLNHYDITSLIGDVGQNGMQRSLSSRRVPIKSAKRTGNFDRIENI